jgi:predicted thioesterase
LISRGWHERFVINKEKFDAKMAAKAARLLSSAGAP